MFFQTKVLVASVSITQNVPRILGLYLQTCPENLSAGRVQTSPGQFMKMSTKARIYTLGSHQLSIT